MIRLKNLLAEQLILGNPKNLTESQKRYYRQLLSEQLNPTSLAGQGYCVFEKALVERKLTPKEFIVDAEFANNMVSLEKGLVSNNLAAIDTKIKEIVTACQSPQFNAKQFKVEINGQATSANPGTKGPKGVTLDHPGGKLYGGLDISKDENKQLGNLYLAKQRAESIKARLIAALNAAGVNKRLPDLDKRITTTGKVVPGGSAAKGLRVFKVTVFVPEATQDPEFRVGSFATISVTYAYTWAQFGSINDFADPTQFRRIWQPMIQYSYNLNFGVAGLAGFDFSAADSDISAQPGYSGLFTHNTGKHSGDGSGNWGFLGDDGKVDGRVGGLAGSQVSYWIVGDGKPGSVTKWGKTPFSGGGRYISAPGAISAAATVDIQKQDRQKLANWFSSNGYITAAQYDTVKKSPDGLILSVLKKAGVSGFKTPTELQAVKHNDLAANGGTNTEAKLNRFEATLSFDEFIELCNGSTTPTLTKSTFPNAYIYDLTAKDAAGNSIATTTAVKDMPVEPGQLPNVKRTN
jgi:hypothetical protein